MGVIARHQLRQMLGQRRIWLLVTFLILPVAVALLTRGEGSSGGYALMLYLIYPQSICVLLALLYGSAVLSSEMELQTLTYLFVRPIPRWHVVIGKYVTTALVLLIAVNVSFAVAWISTGNAEMGSLFARVGLAASLSIVAYTAVFTMLGVITPNRAMIFGILAAVVEFVLSLVPAVINTVTISYYLRSLAVKQILGEIPTGQIPDFSDVMRRMVGDASTPESIGALLLATAVCLTVACRVVTKKVYIEQVEI